jgi:hypothetical protein
VKIQYDYASGDRLPDDDKSGTFDLLFGARRFEFGPTGIYGWIYRSNVNTPGCRLELRPTPRLALLSAFRWAWLAQPRGPWVGTTLRDARGESGSYIGSQAEFRLRYNLGHVVPEIGYARFFKGSFVEHVPNSPGAEDSNYFYIQISFLLDDLLK